MGELLLAVTFFADARKLAVASNETGLHIVDVESGKQIGAGSEANFVVASPDDKTLAVVRNAPKLVTKRRGNEKAFASPVYASATVVLLAADTCRELHQIKIAGSDVWALAFSPDGKTLAATTGWETGRIHLYDVATGREFRTIDTPAIRSPALAFTPDGSKLICGMADTSVLVWDLQAKP